MMKTLKTVASIIGLTSALSLISAGIASAQISISGSFMETRIDQSSVSASVEYIINLPINDSIRGVQLQVEHLNPGTNASSIRSLTVISVNESDISSKKILPNVIGNQSINPLRVNNNNSNANFDSNYSSVSGGLE